MSERDDLRKELGRKYVMGEISSSEYYSALERLDDVEPYIRPDPVGTTRILDTLGKNLGNIGLYAQGKISHEEEVILSWKNQLMYEDDSYLRNQLINLIRNMQDEVRRTQRLRFYDVNVPNHIKFKKLTDEDVQRLAEYGIMDDPLPPGTEISARIPESGSSIWGGMEVKTFRWAAPSFVLAVGILFTLAGTLIIMRTPNDPQWPIAGAALFFLGLISLVVGIVGLREWHKEKS